MTSSAIIDYNRTPHNKQSFTLVKQDESVMTINRCRISNLKKFHSRSKFFADYYKSGRVLYHKTNGMVYSFRNELVKEIGTYRQIPWKPISLQSLVEGTSYYATWQNYIYEFYIYEKPIDKLCRALEADSDEIKLPDYKLKIRKVKFSDENRAVSASKPKFNFTFSDKTKILLVGDCVCISIPLTFYNLNDKNLWCIGTPNGLLYPQDPRAVIFHLEKGGCNVFRGMIDFNVISNRFVVSLQGMKFRVIDIKVWKNMFTLKPDIVRKINDKIFVDAIVSADRIPEFIDEDEKMNDDEWLAKNKLAGRTISVANVFIVSFFDTDGKHKLTRYTIGQDRVYKPEPNECISCYRSITRDCVIVPCGNRQHCEDCAKRIVEAEGKCTKCACAVEQMVKINV